MWSANEITSNKLIRTDHLRFEDDRFFDLRNSQKSNIANTSFVMTQMPIGVSHRKGDKLSCKPGCMSRTTFCVKASLICLPLFLSILYGCCLISLRCYNCIGQPLCNEEPGGIGGCQFLQQVYVKLVFPSVYAIFSHYRNIDLNEICNLHMAVIELTVYLRPKVTSVIQFVFVILPQWLQSTHTYHTTSYLVQVDGNFLNSGYLGDLLWRNCHFWKC